MAGEQWRGTTPSFRGVSQALGAANQGFGNMMQGAQNIIGNMRADEAMKAKLAQQAIDNERAQSLLGIQQAKEGREATTAKRLEQEALARKEQDRILSGILSNVPTSGTTTSTVAVPGVPGNAEEIAAITKANEEIANRNIGLNTDRDVAAAKYDELFNKYSTATKGPSQEPFQMRPDERNITESNKNQVILREYPRVPGESKRTYYETVDGKKIDSIQKFFGGYDVVDKFSNNTPSDRVFQPSNPVAPLSADNLIKQKAELAGIANEKAMKESGMADIVDRFNNVETAKNVPELVKEVKATTKEVTKTGTLSGSEQASAFRNAVLNNKTLTGSSKMEAIAKIEKLFPDSPQEAEAKRRAALIYDVTSKADIMSKFRIKDAKAIAEIESEYKTTDKYKALKYNDEKKEKVANAYAIIKHGNQTFNDNDSIEWEQAYQYLKSVGLKPDEKDFF